MDGHDWHRRFEETLNQLPVMVCEMDRNLRVTYVNEAGYRMTGYTEDDFRSGLYLHNMIPESDWGRAFDNLGRLLEGHSVGIREYRLIHQDGSIGEYQMNSAPIRENGVVVGVRTCLIDMRETHRMTDELEAREEQFRHIFHRSPVAFGLFDAAGAAMEMNEAFRRIIALEDGAPLRLENIIDASWSTGEGRWKGTTLKGEVRRGGTGGPILEWTLTSLSPREDTLLLQLTDVTAQREEEARNAALIASLQRDYHSLHRFADLTSRSPAMQRIFQMLPPLAETDTTVLITGESGTGKERIARAIHAESRRSSGPFIAVNCSALPESLLESELFGYRAGAFTDAKRDKSGKFALARGGVLLLDEIGDMPVAMQAKLLRVLQERRYEPLGGTVSVESDVRILAATHRDLSELVARGMFREDLYYRLNVVHIALPPLRERRGDIPDLCEHFISQFNRRFQKKVSGISSAAAALLAARHFPGNIRELENALEHAFVFCQSETIEPGDLPGEAGLRSSPVAVGDISRFATLEDLEGAFLETIIADCGGSITAAANRLGVHRTTVFRRLRRRGSRCSNATR